MSAPVCRVEPGVSRRFVGLMALVHGTAALVPFALGLQPSVAVALSVGVLGWGGWQVAVHAGWTRGDRLASLDLMADGRARLQLREGGCLDGTLQDVPFTNRLVTLMVFRTAAGRRVVAMVWADGCPAGQYRRLRVCVRWAGWRRRVEHDSGHPDAPA